jgi:S-adenosylmethionine synthetase
MSVSVEAITKYYGSQKALDEVSFTVDPGQVVGFLGPNGAGKSTMMKIITCFLPPSSGKVTVDGFDVRESPVEVRRRVGYLPEHNPLYLDMYVKEFLVFIGGIQLGRAEAEKRTARMIELTGLGPEQKKKIGALSKGYRQRVGLAQSMLHDPAVLILDEPTTGLDPNQLIEIRQLIRNIGKEKTVILSTHIMQEVEAICDRTIIVNKGKIVADEKTAVLKEKLSGRNVVIVDKGHPDKVADQISDALIDHFLAFDPDSKVACETLVTTGQVVLAGEVKSKAYLDVQTIARDVIKKIGYTKSEYMFEANSCGVLSAIHEQSADINQGVDRKKKQDQGAGDQGMMFGYATAETEDYMPLALDLAHKVLIELAALRRENKAIKYLRPDAKSQVTLEYNDKNEPVRIDSIVVSTQHDDFDSEAKMLAKIKEDIVKILIPRVKAKYKKYAKLFNNDIKYHINPTGKFVIGGPHGDTGLTGRKIIVDTYGGKGAHGGGAFSGKDPSKVDRSAAYATRHIAKNLVAAGVCTEVLVQVSYAIGVKDPMGIYVNTYGTAKVKMTDGQMKKVKVVLFPWEKLNAIESVKKAFNLNAVAEKKSSAKAQVKANSNGKAGDKKGKQLMLLA